MAVSLISGPILVALIIVPGYCLVRLSRPAEAHLKLLSATETFYLAAISGIAFTSWVALVLAELGVFSLWMLAFLLALSSIVTFLVGNRIGARHVRLTRPSFIREVLPVLAIVVLGAFLFFKPFEFIFGGWDAGVYVNTGYNIASTGAITMKDPLVASLDPETRSLLFQRIPQSSYEADRALGFYIRDFTSGEVTPQFFHVYPVWIAILTAIGGIKLGLFTTPIFALLGVLGVFFFTRRVFSLPVALLASLFLSISAAQVWFARFPMSEVVVQTFLFSGLWSFVLMLDAHEASQDGVSGSPHLTKCLGIFSGVSLGLVHLTKIEMLPLVPVVVILLGYQWLNRRFHSGFKYFAIGYFLLLAHSILHAVTISAPYTFEIFAAVIGNMRLMLAGAGLALVAILVIVVLRDRLALVINYLLTFYKPLSIALVVLVAMAAGWAYFIRPNILSPEQFIAPNGLLFRTFKEENFVRFAWYVSPLGLLLGIIGLSQTVLERISRRTFLFIAATFLYTATFALSGFVYSSHFWAARRLVPIVIPALVIFAAYAILSSRASRWTWDRAALPAGLAALVIIPLVLGIAPVLPHVEYEGATERVAEMAQEFPPDSIVLFEQSDPAVMLSTPMEIIYGKQSVTLPSNSASNPQLRVLLDSWLKQGKRVFWVSANGNSEPIAKGYVLVPASSFDLSLAEFERPLHKFPSRATVADLLLDIYEVVPGTEQALLVKADLPDGELKWKGFYPPQKDDKESFRWSRSAAELVVPKVGAAKNSFLVLRMAGGRPRGFERGEAAIYVDDRLIRKTVLPEQMKSFAIPLPADVAASSGPELRVRIEPSIVYNPREVSEFNEDREVGIKIAWIALKTIDRVGE